MLSHPRRALAPIYIACLLFSAPAMADTFGVSLSSGGAAGDACTGAAAAAEAFTTGGPIYGSDYLSYSGSAVGYDNGSPTPGTGGCGNTVFANVAANGTVAPGVIKAYASADMTYPLIQAGASIDESWNDTFTAISGGTYLLTFTLNVNDDASPPCPYGNPETTVGDSNTVMAYGFEAIARWNYNDCSASRAPGIYGDATIVNNNTVQIPVYVSAGGTFTVSSQLEIDAQAQSNESNVVNASNTAYVDIVGENGATYSSASGATYNYTDSGTPEPAASLLTGCGLAVLGLRLRGRFSARPPGAA